MGRYKAFLSYPKIGPKRRATGAFRVRSLQEWGWEQAMRKSWRTWAMIVLLGAWPHFGCHQLPGNKSVQEMRPAQPTPESAKKLELTTADITQAAWLASVDALEKERKTNDVIAVCERM